MSAGCRLFLLKLVELRNLRAAVTMSCTVTQEYTIARISVTELMHVCRTELADNFQKQYLDIFKIVTLTKFVFNITKTNLSIYILASIIIKFKYQTSV